MLHVRSVARRLVVFLHALGCFTDKLTSKVLESMGLTTIAIITIPLGCVNQLGLIVHYIFHLLLDVAFMLFAFVIFPLLSRFYWLVLRTVQILKPVFIEEEEEEEEETGVMGGRGEKKKDEVTFH